MSTHLKRTLEGHIPDADIPPVPLDAIKARGTRLLRRKWVAYAVASAGVLAAVVATLNLLPRSGTDDRRLVPGPAGTPSTSASRIDAESPCELLTPEDVEAAIGTEVASEAEVESRDAVTRICSYETGEPWSSVGISLETEASRAEFEERLSRDPPNTEPVNGVGEGAFIHGCSGIVVYENEVLVSAGVQHLTTCEETGEVLRRLGTTLVGALRQAGSP